ncbi:sulfurtransferase [Ideonella sp. DXS22W]|uniref:tRNA uridine(34) hydroxylase n=1 Tax=Pseudaquabacterium inlustre TaxID=2984192 RepID=A0ABU9CBD6_9BURK
MAPILNISTYRFVPLDDLPALRDTLHQRAAALQLKGTVLLAEEGINLFLAGPAEGVNAWLDALRADARFAGLEAKESWSDSTPFKRLKVKIKREIIRMNRPTIRPANGRAPALAPEVLARWLTQGHDDAGRPVRMLDTRNAFEVDDGAFDNAIDWRIAKFTEFPDALEAHRTELQDVTVVSYCTGGIRCEKAAILMQDLGLTNSWQLEGGILKYLELTTRDGVAPGWHGRCFVFDERVGLDPALHPAPASAGAAA